MRSETRSQTATGPNFTKRTRRAVLSRRRSAVPTRPPLEGASVRATCEVVGSQRFWHDLCFGAVSIVADFSRASAELELERRLRETPASAKIRGIFFRILEDDLNQTRVSGLREIGTASWANTAPELSTVPGPRSSRRVCRGGGHSISPDSREGLKGRLPRDLPPRFPNLAVWASVAAVLESLTR